MAVEIVQLDATNLDLLGNVADIFDEPIRPERVAAYVAQPAHIMMLAVSDGQVVGQLLGVLHYHPDKATELYVDDLAVDESWGRRGIATRLVEQLVAEGRRRGASEIWVAVEPSNEQAAGFYASRGLARQAAWIYDRELES